MFDMKKIEKKNRRKKDGYFEKIEKKQNITITERKEAQFETDSKRFNELL